MMSTAHNPSALGLDAQPLRRAQAQPRIAAAKRRSKQPRIVHRKSLDIAPQISLPLRTLFRKQRKVPNQINHPKSLIRPPCIAVALAFLSVIPSGNLLLRRTR
jgi:hypothetical protein